jgi:hypothetical protein
MQSDFELMDYARERRAALRKNGFIMVAAGILVVTLIQLKLIVGWMVMFVFIVVFVLGIVQPIRYRLKHHPFRTAPKEKRFARALLVGCTIGYAFVVAAAILMGIDGDSVYRASRLCMVAGVLSFCLPIFFSYKNLEDSNARR